MSSSVSPSPHHDDLFQPPPSIQGPVIWGIIAAGGSGQRFAATNSGQDKLLSDLAGIPVLIRTLQALLTAPSVAGITVVASADNRPVYEALVRCSDHIPKNAAVHWATGGTDRQSSVMNGLLSVPDTVTHVAIHDAARPLIEQESIERVVAAALNPEVAGAILAVPVIDTIKQIILPQQPANLTGQALGHHPISRTLDRRPLQCAQTPQVFQRDILLAAHQQFQNRLITKPDIDFPATDDAQLIELAGLGTVVTVPGTASNLKITTPDDLIFAKAWLQLLST